MQYRLCWCDSVLRDFEGGFASSILEFYAFGRFRPTLALHHWKQPYDGWRTESRFMTGPKDDAAG